MAAGPGAGGPSPAPGPAESPVNFGDRLAAAVAARESQVVLGLDPDPARLWPVATRGVGASPAPARPAAMPRGRRFLGARPTLRDRGATGPRSSLPRRDRGFKRPGSTSLDPGAESARDRPTPPGGDAAAPPSGPKPYDRDAAPPGSAAAPQGDPRVAAAAAVEAHCRALIDAVGPACVAVKPQLACFERLGAPGWGALERVCAHARAAGLLVIADGKRGDVPVTAAAYAQALLGGTPSPFGLLPGLGVDAFTANPLLGRDALAPLVEAARGAGAGVFLLVRTSNPGAADVLDADLRADTPLWTLLALLAAELGTPGEHGLADVGAVMGATEPEHLARARALMPHTPFLLPGIGAQGGDVAGLAAAFAPGPAGGLVTASRSIAHAYETAGGSPAEAARAEAERLREQAWALV